MRRGVELRLDLVAGAAGAASLGTTALDHEPFDDPVEDQSIIETDLGQRQEIPDVARRHVGQKLKPNGALAGVELGGVALVLEVERFLGVRHLGFDIAVQGAPTFRMRAAECARAAVSLL